MKKSLLITFCLSLFFLNAFAQDKVVSGTVTSNTDGQALPGVTVLIKGTSTGTQTDLDGKYSLKTSEGAVLVFSFIGMETQEIAVGNRSVVDVVLAESVRQLTEVVVTAMGVKRDERSLGYAVQQVGGGELDKAREMNAVNSLSGKVAGVQITAGGGMGGSSRVVIRGTNSVTGQNQPLFVVDGNPIDNSNFTDQDQIRGSGGYDYGNAAQDLNPDDIESISVLKGPSAAALYGSRASNGVILITTKKGKARKGVGISVNSGVTISTPFILPDFQNSYGGGTPQGFTDGQYVGYNVDESFGPKFEGQQVRHWDSFDDWDTQNFGKTRAWQASPNDVSSFLETGVTQNYGIALDGGSDVATYRLSMSMLDHKDMLPNGKMSRYNMSFNGTLKLTDKLTSNVSVNYVYNDAVGRSGTGYDGNNVYQQFFQWTQRQLDYSRLKNYKNPDGSQRTWNRRSASDASPQYTDNPYWTRYENYQNDNRSRVYGNIGLNYQVNENFLVTGRLMNDNYTDRREERVAVGSQAISEYREGVRQVNEFNADLVANYSKELTDMSFSAMAGISTRTRNYDRNVGTTQGGLSVPNLYNLQNGISGVLIDDYSEKRRMNSVFGSASFGYKGMAYLDATVRNDWSSTLPSNNNSYFYPSVTASFVFSELPGLSDLSWLSFAKARIGWAQVGSDTDPYNLTNTFTPKENFGSSPNFSVPNTLNNAELKPEITSSIEAGLDLRFFNGRASLDVTYYATSTTDQIIRVSTAPATGYQSRYINAGQMDNKGWEVMLNVTPLKMDNGLQWDLNFNWAANKNKLVSLTEGIDNILLATAPFAVSTNARVGEPYSTILGTDFVYDGNGNKVVNANGTYKFTTGLSAIGNAQPDWTAGIGSTISYKGFSLYTLVDIRSGGDMFSTSVMWGRYSGLLKETAENGIRENGIVVDGVTETGEVNTTNIGAQTHFFNNQGYRIGAAGVFDASYVKLREMRLTYSVPSAIASKLHLSSLNVGIVGRNLWLISSNIPHLDPESATSAQNSQGIEGAQVPRPRTIGFNLNFKL